MSKSINDVICVRFKDRVTLEPALKEYQHLPKATILLMANHFYRYAKQLYKLHDVRQADELWDEEQRNEAR